MVGRTLGISSISFLVVLALPWASVIPVRELGNFVTLKQLWSRDSLAFSRNWFSFWANYCNVRRIETFLANIFALNVFYDVPVKIYSFWLMLIGVYLAFDDAKRLWDFFVMNQATAPKNITDFFSFPRFFDLFFKYKYSDIYIYIVYKIHAKLDINLDIWSFFWPLSNHDCC